MKSVRFRRPISHSVTLDWPWARFCDNGVVVGSHRSLSAFERWLVGRYGDSQMLAAGCASDPMFPRPSTNYALKRRRKDNLEWTLIVIAIYEIEVTVVAGIKIRRMLTKKFVRKNSNRGRTLPMRVAGHSGDTKDCAACFLRATMANSKRQQDTIDLLAPVDCEIFFC